MITVRFTDLITSNINYCHIKIREWNPRCRSTEKWRSYKRMWISEGTRKMNSVCGRCLTSRFPVVQYNLQPRGLPRTHILTPDTQDVWSEKRPIFHARLDLWQIRLVTNEPAEFQGFQMRKVDLWQIDLWQIRLVTNTTCDKWAS